MKSMHQALGRMKYRVRIDIGRLCAAALLVGLVAPATAASSTTFTSKGFGYSVAASAVVEPQVIDVGSSVAARSTDSAGRAINYTDGRWYYADGTPVAAGSSVAPAAAVEPTVTDIGSSVAARSTDDAGAAIYYTDGRWYYANGTPVG